MADGTLVKSKTSCRH